MAALLNGKQETFWDRVEGRLMALLEGVEPLELDFLNHATVAWAEMEVNVEVHDELGVPPLERYLEGPSLGRPSPDIETLRRAFTDQQVRTQRRSDGTVSIEGVRFELPSRLRTQRRVRVQFRDWDLSRAWVVDPRTLDVLARIRPLDKEANADGRRRSLEPLDELPEVAPPPDPVPPLMRKILAEFAATGRPPAYLPKHDPESDDA